MSGIFRRSKSEAGAGLTIAGTARKLVLRIFACYYHEQKKEPYIETGCPPHPSCKSRGRQARLLRQCFGGRKAGRDCQAGKPIREGNETCPRPNERRLESRLEKTEIKRRVV